MQGGYKFWLSKCCLFVESADKNGRRVVYGTEVWDNAFDWRPISFEDARLHELLDLDIVKGLDSFTVLAAQQPFLVATKETDSGVVYSDLYRADASNTHFRKVLANIVLDPGKNAPSVLKSPALEGLFVANVYDENLLKLRSGLKRSKARAGPDGQLYIKSLVSFDFGASWARIRHPSANLDGQPYSCPDLDCHLNLHLRGSEGFPAFYGTKAAPGVIIAQGNVGQLLSFMEEETSTFLSTDGGVSWKEVLRGGSSIFEIVDQGSILVLADFRTPRNWLSYSTDLGASWRSLQFLPETQSLFVAARDQITNMAMEPTNNAHSLLLSGKGAQDSKGFIVAVDFFALFPRYCRGYTFPGAEDSDYFAFYPAAPEASKCRQR